MKALISVYNKEGIVQFATRLWHMGWDFLASGGTYKALREANLPVTDVATITGREAVLGHRVVTLASEIHGGLMASETQKDELKALKWPWIDLVCVDFYPLKDTIREQRKHPNLEEVIRQTDVGGPALVSSACKGRRIVICDPTDHERVIQWLIEGSPHDLIFRDALIGKAYLALENYFGAAGNFRTWYAGKAHLKGSVLSPHFHGLL